MSEICKRYSTNEWVNRRHRLTQVSGVEPKTNGTPPSPTPACVINRTSLGTEESVKITDEWCGECRKKISAYLMMTPDPLA